MSESEVAVKEFTLDEVQQHTSTKSCWLIVGNSTNGKVFLPFFERMAI